jgi:hypothetical protein
MAKCVNMFCKVDNTYGRLLFEAPDKINVFILMGAGNN